MYKKYIGWIIFASLLIFSACSSDDNSNPSTPEAPASVGVYSGTNSMDTSTTITVSNISGTAFVTAYDIRYKTPSGKTGRYAQALGSGFAEVANNSFQFSVGTEADEIVMGTIDGNTMTGSFKFPANPLAPVVSGTFSISK